MAKRIYKNACYPKETISKKTVIACFPEGSKTREWLQSLDNDQWFVTSFIPESRLVCATVYANQSTVTHLAITLPEIVIKNF